MGRQRRLTDAQIAEMEEEEDRARAELIKGRAKRMGEAKKVAVDLFGAAGGGPAAVFGVYSIAFAVDSEEFDDAEEEQTFREEQFAELSYAKSEAVAHFGEHVAPEAVFQMHEYLFEDDDEEDDGDEE